MKAKRITVHGNISERERQIIEGLLALRMGTMFAALGPQQAARGYTQQQHDEALLEAKRFGEGLFPDLAFHID